MRHFIKISLVLIIFAICCFLGCNSNNNTPSPSRNIGSEENIDVSTIAGSSSTGTADGAALTAKFTYPSGIAVDSNGNIYVTDNQVIRRISADFNTVSTVAGTGTQGFQDGPALKAQFRNPNAIAVDNKGNIYVADAGNNRIRRISTDLSTVTTVTGTGVQGFLDGAALGAQFSNPSGIAIDAQGAIYVVDTYNQRIRQISADLATVTTLAGTGNQGGFADGAALSASFNRPTGIAFDAAGNIYIADVGNNRIRRISADWSTVTTIAGSGVAQFQDGPALSAAFDSPSALAVDQAGNIIVSDTNNSRIRVISADLQTVSTIAGGGYGFADGSATTARFALQRGIVVTQANDLLVADSSNARIRLISGMATAY